MGKSLDPTLATRLNAALRPDWTRTLAARRIVAGLLVLLAGLAAVRSDPDGERTGAVVAARDITPGIELTSDDVRIDQVMSTTLPDGSLGDLAAVVGAVPAGPIRRGEVITDVRLLDSRLAEAAAGPDARIVPLHLSDPALLDLVRAGDVVDVLAAPADAETPATVLASAAVVLMVSPKPNPTSPGDDRVVLVALPADTANAVAGAALTDVVTLTFR
ncbi:MAG: SAF domain-containing protein [Mycobacterium sp.]